MYTKMPYKYQSLTASLPEPLPSQRTATILPDKDVFGRKRIELPPGNLGSVAGLSFER